MRKVKVIILLIVFVALLFVVEKFFPDLRGGFSASSVLQPQTASQNDVTAADFTVYDAEGAPVKLSDFVGKPTVVNFWATWCGYCVEELPGFDKLYGEYKDRVNFLMIDLPDGNRETQEGAQKFVQKQGYSFNVFFDTDYSASKAYSVSSIPMTLFVDKSGNLYHTHRGLIEEAALKEYIDTLLQEKS